MTVCISFKKRKIERSKTKKFGRDVKQKETKFEKSKIENRETENWKRLSIDVSCT